MDVFTYYFQFFAENCTKMKEFGRAGGGQGLGVGGEVAVHPFCRPLGSANDSYTFKSLLPIFYNPSFQFNNQTVKTHMSVM